MTDQRREPDGPQITPTQPSMPESRPQPDGKLTVKVDKDEVTRQLLDKVLSKLTEVGDSQGEFREGLLVLGGKVDVLGGKVDTVTVDVHAIKAEQVEFREWKGAVEERFKTHSLGATALAGKTQTLSVHDDHQDVKLQELENRLAIAAESSMRTILAEATTAATAAAKTPLGQKVMKAAGYAALAFFVLATAYFGTMTARIQQQPPTIIQVAPVVAASDGGLR